MLSESTNHLYHSAGLSPNSSIAPNQSKASHANWSLTKFVRDTKLASGTEGRRPDDYT